MVDVVSLSEQELGTTGWRVSQAGFGCYRVDVSVEEHRKALKKALCEGINLIDTSANYSDGGSEELVGAVLAEVGREGMVVVSKVGYLQGQNYELSQQRKREGRPFPDLVLYGQGLEHCMHPVFLEDQLTRSLGRLRMETLDCYLLHNPEYYLGWAKKETVPLEQAREEYYRRIELAFRHLEQEVERGRIRCYGISSNTFPAPEQDPQFTSLERVWEIAERISPDHHFRVIQLPMNLFETGGVTEKNQSEGRSVIAFAKSKGIGVLINRPLNAFVGNALVRLADVEVGEVPEVASFVQQLAQQEAELKGTLFPNLNEKVADQLSAGVLLQEHWRSFSSLEHWQEVVGQFLVPTVQSGIRALLQETDAQAWVQGYVAKVNETLQAVTAHYKRQEAERADAIKQQVAEADAEWAAADGLSGMAVRALRLTEGVACVLVGMRQERYVEDVLLELKQPVEVRDREASWQALVINRRKSAE
ncbi:MAG: aldo/keto reductase [Tumebacillaceae bacterium]